MKCLTCLEPWATAMVAGIKPIENRPWRVRHRGELAIHAGLSTRWFTDEACGHLHRLWPAFPADPKAALEMLRGNLGNVIGVVSVRDCLTLEDALGAGYTAERDIARGPWCAVLDAGAARRLVEPVEWRGRLGLFEVPETVVGGEWVRSGEVRVRG